VSEANTPRSGAKGTVRLAGFSWPFGAGGAPNGEMAAREADDHFENPGQGTNPNSALTRPQAIGPLTLVGQWSGGVTHRETPSTFNTAG
jgi:hypothetical protein